MKSPLVSVIIPVYNVEKYIFECLDSVLAQDYENLEVVVVDDGSTDGTGEICDEFSLLNKRVKVFHQKNGGPGPSSARNLGLLKARGEFVTFVDSDDFVKRNYVSKMVQAMKPDVDIVISGYNNIVPEKKVLSGKEATEKLLISQENLEIVVWGKLYRKNVLEGILYPVGEKYEDSLTAYKVLVRVRKVSYLAESLYEYRERKGSIMNEAELLERLVARRKAAEEAVEYFKEDEDLRAAAKIAVLTSKYAFLDAAIRKEIDKNYYVLNSEWIKKHKNEFKNNKFMTQKLRFYNFLNSVRLYKVFRTIV